VQSPHVGINERYSIHTGEELKVKVLVPVSDRRRNAVRTRLEMQGQDNLTTSISS
jgi:hypothetical protein